MIAQFDMARHVSIMSFHFDAGFKATNSSPYSQGMKDVDLSYLGRECVAITEFDICQPLAYKNKNFFCWCIFYFTLFLHSEVIVKKLKQQMKE